MSQGRLAALRWRLHGWADWHQERGQWRTATAVDGLAIRLFRAELARSRLVCWWCGCDPDYEHPCELAPCYVVCCKRCMAPDTSYADRLGDTRQHRVAQWAWWWLWRRWWPAKCCGCGRRFGRHDACDEFPF